MNTTTRLIRIRNAGLLALAAAFTVAGVAASDTLREERIVVTGPVRAVSNAVISDRPVQATIEGHSVCFVLGGQRAVRRELELPSRPVSVGLRDGSDIAFVAREDGVAEFLKLTFPDRPWGLGLHVESVSTFPTGLSAVVEGLRDGDRMVVHSDDTAARVNATDPLVPFGEGSVFVPGGVKGMSNQGDVTHLLDYQDNLIRLDPGSVLVTPVPGASFVAHAGSYVGVATGSTIEFRDAATDQLINSVGVAGPLAGFTMRGTDAAWMTQSGGLYFADVTDVQKPVVDGPYPSGYDDTPIVRADMGIGWDDAVSCALETQAVTFDPVTHEVVIVSRGDRTRGVAVGRDGTVLFANGREGLGSYADGFEGLRDEFRSLMQQEVRDPATWSPTGPPAGGRAARVPAPPRSVAVPGEEFALVATDEGAAVLAIGHGTTIEVGSWPRSNVKRVATARGPGGERLGLALESGRLNILDLSAPASPQLASFVTTTFAEDVSVDGALVVVARINQPALLVDITDPAHPIEIGTVPVTGARATLDGDRIYAAIGARLQVVDVADPASPALLGHLDLTAIYGIAVEHRPDGAVWAWIANGQAGVAVVDVTDPGNLSVVTTLDTPDVAWDIARQGERVWVADGDSGLRMLELVADPAPRLRPAGDGDRAADVAASPSPSPSLGLSVFPNPSRASATITFDLPRPGRAALSVYDVSGRRLARVADATFDAGRNRLAWDGRDQAGRRVPAGVYLIRLEGDDGGATARVVRLD